jgi:hypothetical protein
MGGIGLRRPTRWCGVAEEAGFEEISALEEYGSRGQFQSADKADSLPVSDRMPRGETAPLFAAGFEFIVACRSFHIGHLPSASPKLPGKIGV